MSDLTTTKTKSRQPVGMARRQDMPIDITADKPMVASSKTLPGMARTAGQLISGIDADEGLGGRGLGRPTEDEVTTLPAVIQTALSTSRQGVKAYQMANIMRQWPAQQRAKIESVGKALFSQQSERPISVSDVFTVNSLTNSRTEVKKMLAWVWKHCMPKQRDIQYSFPSAPGYEPKAEVWDGDGVRFLLVRETPEDFGEDIDPRRDFNEQNLFYVYGWDEPTASARRLDSGQRKALAESARVAVHPMVEFAKALHEALSSALTEARDPGFPKTVSVGMIDPMELHREIYDNHFFKGRREHGYALPDVLTMTYEAEETGIVEVSVPDDLSLRYLRGLVEDLGYTMLEKKAKKKNRIGEATTDPRDGLRDEVLDVIDNAVEYYFDEVQGVGKDCALENALDFVDAVADEDSLTGDEILKAKNAIRARLNESIEPDAKDKERAENRYSKAQAQAMAKAIKDPEKALRRGLAFAMSHNLMNSGLFRDRAEELGATAAQLAEFDAREKEINAERNRAAQEEENRKRKELADSIPKGLVKELNPSETVSIMYRSRRRIGSIYSDYIMSNGFQGDAFYFRPNGSDKPFWLRDSFRNYGLGRYEDEVKIIKDFQVKPVGLFRESTEPQKTFVCVGAGRVEIIEGAEAMSAEAVEGNKFVVNPNYRGGEDEYRFYGKLDIGKNSFKVSPGLSGRDVSNVDVDFGNVVYAIRKQTVDGEPSDFWATWTEA